MAGQVADERGGQGSNAIAIKQTEDVVVVVEIEDDTISIAVKRAASVEGGGLRRGWSTLAGLDKVGTALDDERLVCEG